ncbi:MAG: phospholipase A [Steroidobacteraceae bacterium]
MKKMLILLCLLAVPAWADDLLITVQPTAAARDGEEMELQLAVFNAGSESASYQPPMSINGALRNAANTWPVTLLNNDGLQSRLIAPGEWLRLTYKLQRPAEANGAVALDLRPFTAAPLALDLRAVGNAAAQSQTPLPSAVVVEQPPTLSLIERTFANHFAFHEPIYFIYGTKAPAAKFQFSFKYRLAGADGNFGEAIPPLRGFYFAYTQRSLWDLDAKSSPFYDTSYMPELFYEWLAPGERRASGGFHWLGIQTGVQHESNGKDDDDSRSLNIINARGGMVFGSLNGWHAIVAPRAYYYINATDELRRYRGYGDLMLAISKNNSTQVSMTMRSAKLRGKGSTQVDVTQPVNIPWIDLRVYLQLQYFNGYGESLRNYNQKMSIWRVGLGFVR